MSAKATNYQHARSIWDMLVLSLTIDLFLLIVFINQAPNKIIPLWIEGATGIALTLSLLATFKKEIFSGVATARNIRADLQNRFGTEIVLPLVIMIALATLLEIALRIGVHSLPQILIVGVFSLLIAFSSFRMYRELKQSIQSPEQGNTWLAQNFDTVVSLLAPVLARVTALLSIISFLIHGDSTAAALQYLTALLLMVTSAPTKGDFTLPLQGAIRKDTRDLRKQPFDKAIFSLGRILSRIGR